MASEAHVSGIPVVGSRLGGLIEAIGPGGMLIDPAAPAEVWCKALRTLWRDKQCYAGLSDAARRYSKRDDVSESVLMDRMFAEIELAIALRNALRNAAAQAATPREFADG